MTHPYIHSQSSARVFGGCPEDYLPVHEWLDASKEHFCDFRHRAVRHHAEGVFEAERVFGVVIVNSDGNPVPTRYVAEQHVREDCAGRVPTLAEWLSQIQVQPWMARSIRTFGERARRVEHDSTV